MKKEEKTYCPFLPICPKTGKVLEIPLLELDKKTEKQFLIIMEKKLKQVF